MNSTKAFTIIEMIFVIVIIGVLALVAIPRLSATYDDARVSLVLKKVGTLINDLGTYYTTKDFYSPNLDDMTYLSDVNFSQPWDSVAEKGVITLYTPDNEKNLEPCVHFSIENRDGNLTVYNASNPVGDICKSLHQITTYKALLGTKLIGGNRVKF
jgi:prepilin-type N-terminal cleavage/methylation domain-containing protein